MKKRNGFTLIELLTMTAIMLLLVMIFLPSLQNVKQQANSVAYRSSCWNDITFSPVELVLVSLDGISGKPTIVGKLLAWEQISESPEPYGNYGPNLWIYDDRCISDTCSHRNCRIPHTCINRSEDNAKGIFTGSLVDKIEQK